MDNITLAAIIIGTTIFIIFYLIIHHDIYATEIRVVLFINFILSITIVSLISLHFAKLNEYERFYKKVDISKSVSYKKWLLDHN